VTTSSDILAFGAEFELFDQALASERGVQRLFAGKDGRGAAFNFRVRLHSARKHDRRHSREVYEPGHHLYNKTPYSAITVREPYFDEKKDAWVLKLEKHTLEAMVVEEIDD